MLMEDLLSDYNKNKVLTFRDMSHLSYFGARGTLTRKTQYMKDSDQNHTVYHENDSVDPK